MRRIKEIVRADETDPAIETECELTRQIPPVCDERVTPPMLVNEISRLFGAWMRIHSGQTGGVMAQNSARLIMRSLSFCDGVSQLELVRGTSLRPPTVSVTLKKMEDEGLIRRETDGNDRRAVRVYLTEKGRELDESVRERLGHADRLLMNGFSEDEYATAKKVLLRMRGNILADLRRTGDFPPATGSDGGESDSCEIRNATYPPQKMKGKS